MENGYVKLKKLLDDPTISEIMINGPSKVFAEKSGVKVPTDVVFANEQEVLELVDKIFALRGKRVDKDIPYSDVCLEDGTRINAIISPLSRFGVSVTFRKFSKSIKTGEDLVRLGAMDQQALNYLIDCIKTKKNIIISGGTGVGKTTVLQALSRFFTPDERVITIEDAAELRLEQPNVVSLETRPKDRDGKGEVTLRDLIANALRMTPDRLIIGEVRGAEAIDMIQAMATGHSGTLGILHGNSPREVIGRLETMILLSGIALPLPDIRRLIASTIEVIVHLQRMDGTRKVTSISTIDCIRQGEIVLKDIFGYAFSHKDANGKDVYALKPLVALMS
ncbi:MAG TPA: ATPase, T2SS/T4P/T4SS family [Elusimicrobiota bacterium]|jgi:pilus assembly protein CpaF|nr:ATPase, T2SS/T4P/T4SS family [Elusimicrobiota bacterium]